MTGGIGRRQAGGMVALLPALALGWPTGAAARTSTPRPPTGALKLIRTLTWGLGDGKAIVVTRGWTISVASDDAGFLVTGAQVSAEVTAPPVLSALAELERRRDASGLFPVRLDPAGMILTTGSGSAGATLVRGIETARTLIASLPLAEAVRTDAGSFMANLARMGAAAVSQPPRDLFFPTIGSDNVTRSVPLPGGEVGTVTVTSTAQTMPGTGFLRSSERSVVTRLADSERTASERWEATPAP